MHFLYYLLYAIQWAPWKSNNLEGKERQHVLFVGCGDYIRCALEINTGFGIFNVSGFLWFNVNCCRGKTTCHLDFVSSYLTQVSKIYQSGDKGIYPKKCMCWFWFGKFIGMFFCFENWGVLSGGAFLQHFYCFSPWDIVASLGFAFGSFKSPRGKMHAVKKMTSYKLAGLMTYFQYPKYSIAFVMG